jgi:hypothetical protein
MNNQDQARAGECGTFRQLMDSFVPDDPDTDTKGALARHLENCSNCATEWQQRNRLSTRLKAAVHRQYVPSDLQMRVRGRLDGRTRGRWWQMQRTQWAVSAAASLAIAFALWTTYRRTHMPAISDRHGQEIYIQKISARLSPVLRLGLGDHVHCAIFRKYPDNAPTAAQMLSDLGPSYHDLLDLVKKNIAEDYRVVMAHQCSFAGRRYVHITLKKGTELVSLVITRKQDGEFLPSSSPALAAAGVSVYGATAERYKLATFDAGRYLGFVVSDLPESTNLQIAGKLAPVVHEYLVKFAA